MNITNSQRLSIEAMIDDGLTNGKIALKFPGITKKQLADIRANMNPATPQTKSKLKADPLRYLYEAEKIDSGDLVSAERIKMAYRVITGDVDTRCASLETFIDKSRSLGVIESEYQIAVQQDYKQWHVKCAEKHIHVDPIIRVLTQPVSLDETDAHFQKRKGYTANVTIQGLKTFSDLKR